MSLECQIYTKRFARELTIESVTIKKSAKWNRSVAEWRNDRLQRGCWVQIWRKFPSTYWNTIESSSVKLCKRSDCLLCGESGEMKASSFCSYPRGSRGWKADISKRNEDFRRPYILHFTNPGCSYLQESKITRANRFFDTKTPNHENVKLNSTNTTCHFSWALSVMQGSANLKILIVINSRKKKRL